MKRICIHQPTFFPWIGLFHKIRNCDEFVFFDHVQMPGGKSWISRNKFLNCGEVKWFTLPIVRKNILNTSVANIQIDHGSFNISKVKRTLESAYRKAEFFDEMKSVITPLLEEVAEFKYIADYNIHLTLQLSQNFKLACNYVRSSELDIERDLLGNDIVLHLCIARSATHYLSGTGCTDFIIPDSFSDSGISFDFQSIRHPVYLQPGGIDFVSHLSIIDVIANYGLENIRRWLEQSFQLPTPLQMSSSIPEEISTVGV